MLRTVLAALAALALGSTARADFVIVAPTAAAPGSFTITAPVTFTITTVNNATARYFVLDEYVISDNTRDNSGFSPELSVSFNGGLPTTLGAGGAVVDNYGSPLDSITANDGLIIPGGSFFVSPGDTVTLNAATYTLAPVANFNPQATQTFTGNAFITDFNGTRLSDIVPVGEGPPPPALPTPLPPTALAGLLGLAGLGLARRSRRVAG